MHRKDVKKNETKEGGKTEKIPERAQQNVPSPSIENWGRESAQKSPGTNLPKCVELVLTKFGANSTAKRDCVI